MWTGSMCLNEDYLRYLEERYKDKLYETFGYLLASN